jgi:hypothetical protein
LNHKPECPEKRVRAVRFAPMERNREYKRPVPDSLTRCRRVSGADLLKAALLGFLQDGFAPGNLSR